MRLICWAPYSGCPALSGVREREKGDTLGPAYALSNLLPGGGGATFESRNVGLWFSYYALVMSFNIGLLHIS